MHAFLGELTRALHGLLPTEGLARNILAATVRMQANTSPSGIFSGLTGNTEQLTHISRQRFFHKDLRFYYLYEFYNLTSKPVLESHVSESSGKLRTHTPRSLNM